MDGLETLEPLRKTGLYAYDSVPRYRATRKGHGAQGLGTVDEFKYLQTQTDKPIKATCPGPVTLSIHNPDPPGRRLQKRPPRLVLGSRARRQRRAQGPAAAGATGYRSTSPRRPSCPVRPPST